MSFKAIRILFLKDLFLSRRFLFAYFAGGLTACGIACLPSEVASFVGFMLMITVAIAAGIHFIGILLLSESIDQTRLFVMSLPVSLLDYSIGKMAVVLTTFLIPWTAMLACTTICTFAIPWSRHGSAIVLPAIFLFLLSGFTLQLVTAVVSESIGWTICVMVTCNVLLNVFLMKLYGHAEVSQIIKGNEVIWPSFVLQIMVAEVLFIAVTLAAAIVLQTRKRDLI